MKHRITKKMRSKFRGHDRFDASSCLAILNNLDLLKAVDEATHIYGHWHGTPPIDDGKRVTRIPRWHVVSLIRYYNKPIRWKAEGKRLDIWVL